MKGPQHNIYADPLWERLGSGEIIDALARDRVPYQDTLRAVGALLDEEGAQRFNLLETGLGFVVRVQRDRTQPDSSVREYSSDELLKFAGDLRGKRRRLGLGLFGRDRVHSGTERSYENILRALGFELDQVEAYSLLIDEVEEGMLVTYQYLRPTEGFNLRKRMVILGEEAVQAVLEDAMERREHRKHGVLSLLAS